MSSSLEVCTSISLPNSLRSPKSFPSPRSFSLSTLHHHSCRRLNIRRQCLPPQFTNKGEEEYLPAELEEFLELESEVDEESGDELEEEIDVGELEREARLAAKEYSDSLSRELTIG